MNNQQRMTLEELSELSHIVYHTSRWRKLRRSYREEVGNKCEICGEPNRKLEDGSSILELHHFVPLDLNNWREMAFDRNNLILLCQDCHDRIHKRPLRSESQGKPQDQNDQPQNETSSSTSEEEE